jgi:hypothetical protein
MYHKFVSELSVQRRSPTFYNVFRQVRNVIFTLKITSVLPPFCARYQTWKTHALHLHTQPYTATSQHDYNARRVFYLWVPCSVSIYLQGQGDQACCQIQYIDIIIQTTHPDRTSKPDETCLLSTCNFEKSITVANPHGIDHSTKRFRVVTSVPWAGSPLLDSSTTWVVARTRILSHL